MCCSHLRCAGRTFSGSKPRSVKYIFPFCSVWNSLHEQMLIKHTSSFILIFPVPIVWSQCVVIPVGHSTADAIADRSATSERHLPNTYHLQSHSMRSRVAQWKRAGPITQRSEDQNLALLNFLFLFTYRLLFTYRFLDNRPQLFKERIIVQ